MLLPKLRLGLLDKNFFMHHVRNHKYVKACGDVIKPLIKDAFQVLHRPEVVSDSIDPLSHILRQPRLPHEVLLAVCGWSGGSRQGGIRYPVSPRYPVYCIPTNTVEAYDIRVEKWVNISGMEIEKIVGQRIVLNRYMYLISCEVYS